MKRAARMIIFAAGLAAGGCVTAPPPKQSYVEASSAIRAAEEVVRADVPMPDAELYLARARDHARAGEKLLERRDYSDAELAFERAEVEAETAISLARARLAEHAAKQAEARLEGAVVEMRAGNEPAPDDDDDDDDTEVEIDVDD